MNDALQRSSRPSAYWLRCIPLLLMFAGVFLPLATARADDCTSTSSGPWTTSSNWDCNKVPSADDNVFIENRMTAASAIATSNLTISSTGVLSTSADLTISGTMTILGAFTPVTGTTVIFNSSAVTQVLTGSDILTFQNIVIDNDHAGAGVWVDFPVLVEVTGTVTVTTGSALSMPADNITYAEIDNELINNGKFKFTREIPIGGGSNIQFPTGNAIGYYGVAITTTNELGSVTVIIEGNAADCTESASVNYVQRCYTIIPTNNLSATVRFFALDGELNSLTLADLVPYHYVSGSGWTKLTNVSTGTLAPNYNWVQGDTTGFSSFLLADTNDAPTVVSLTSLTAAAVSSHEWLTALLLAGLALLLYTWSVRRRKVG